MTSDAQGIFCSPSSCLTVSRILVVGIARQDDLAVLNGVASAVVRLMAPCRLKGAEAIAQRRGTIASSVSPAPSTRFSGSVRPCEPDRPTIGFAFSASRSYDEA